MTYKIDFDRFGRFFSVPCSIVDKYMRIADGNFIKVLLCILASESSEADSFRLSEQTGVTESIVRDAVLFWSEVGVLRTDGQASIDSKPSPAEAKVPVHKDPEPAVREPEAQAKKSVRYSPKELANKVEENSDLKNLVAEYEKIKGTPIRDNEIVGLINLTEYYGFDAQSLLLIIEYCHKLGKDNIAYIEKVAKDWFSRDIVEYAEVEEEIIRQTKILSYESKTARAFGLSRKLSKHEKEFINSWQNMGFSIEMLEIAYDRCIDIKKELNFKYINGILCKWAGRSVFTPEQVEQDDKLHSEKSKKNNAGKKETSYDLDEWEQFARNFDPTAKRGVNNG